MYSLSKVVKTEISRMAELLNPSRRRSQSKPKVSLTPKKLLYGLLSIQIIILALLQMSENVSAVTHCRVTTPEWVPLYPYSRNTLLFFQSRTNYRVILHRVNYIEVCRKDMITFGDLVEAIYFIQIHHDLA